MTETKTDTPQTPVAADRTPPQPLPDDLDAETCDSLRDLCRQRDISPTGTKAELVERLEAVRLGGAAKPGQPYPAKRPRGRTLCPRCKRGILISRSTRRKFTWYLCPHCNKRIKIPR